MSLVWQLDLPDSQKIVLLALADSANDEGHCWPSMRSLSLKCSKGERTIQGVIKQLCEAGHLTRREVLGKGCNYTVHPRSGCAPAETAPTPAEVAPHPRSGCGQTVIEPSKNRKSAAPKRAAVKPDCVSDEVWRDLIDQRRAKRAPLTATALEEIEREASKVHWPLEDAIRHMLLKGWQGFESRWVEPRAAPAKAVDPSLAAASLESTARTYRRIGRDNEAAEMEAKAMALRREAA